MCSNFLIGGGGLVYIGRFWNKVGTHIPEYNSKSIGIGFIGNYNNIDPTSEQVATTQKLIQLGVSLGKIAANYTLLAACQVRDTEIPGRKLIAILKTWPHLSSEKVYTD